ncbi:MAG TPA: 4Fe-4S binding protein [Candidatus Marinimicrobia bacterium]|nr:4Fe-4S binding protein [Candidatus Neomarinimicrobiota bacterium]HNZ36991.1 4Fe-4S binding protein [Candidatus Neomarinimicrobiota bacterium]HOD38302.1 4Fe-4S binding protein [Candidatus Neomarinimicrobiota bacterium]HOU16351.1 4Fe-4S binding protein [Candidatus Neomarinimicrobiota bacterium]HPD25139.1 4Fe-4S binding protein [Candidatus Neomarinimicrobiota bacterium]
MIEVNPDCCDLCGTCISVCPKDCITLTESRLIVDDSQCNVCQICVRVCPFKALRLVE